MIRSNPTKLVAIIGLSLLLSTVFARADQVITPDQRQWARQAIQQEKQLAAMTKPNSIAILYFRNLSEDRALDPLQKGLAIMLISDLSKLDMITVVERTELQALVEEIGLGQSGLVDSNTTPRVGRLLQSQYLIGGSFSGSAATTLHVGAHLIDVAPGKTIGRAEVKDKMEQLFTIEKQLLNQIILDLKLNLTQQQRRDLGRPLSRSQGALLDLFRGIDAVDHQQFDSAAQFMDRAIQQDPNLTLAKTSLQELKDKGLVPPSYGGGDGAPTPEEKAGEAEILEHRRQMLRSVRKETSFSTQLPPATPLARIPQPPSVQPTSPPQEGESPIFEPDEP